MALSPGTKLGPYEVIAPLGSGGMGEVYRARDSRLARDVALKVLPGDLAGDPDRVSRFEREARAASALNHPAIVAVFDIANIDSTSVIVMELVDGKTLRETVASGPVPIRRLLSIAAQVADGLAKAHAAGIVHRDLKPENIMVSRDGFAKILDFGLAKLVPNLSGPEQGTNLPTVTRATTPGIVMGTVGYMSPEQASGQEIDFRSDQFSLGAILYEMAAGRRAFERQTAIQTLSAIIQDEPAAIASVNSKVPANLVWIIERCLAKDPEERYGSTKDLARDLATIRDHASDTAVAEAAPGRRPVRRTGFAAAGVAVVVAALVGLASWKLGERHGLRAPPPSVEPMTYQNGHITGARFSPDGQSVVYSAHWDGRPSEIFELRFGGDVQRSLGIFPAGILAISSSGEMAISLGCEDLWDPCFGTLARVPLGGASPREVLENVLSADWSPDGQSLAVSHSTGKTFRLEYPIGKVLFETSGWVGDVHVSPNGDLVGFVDHPSLDMESGYFSLVDREGHARRLTPLLPQARSLAWKRSGDALIVEGVFQGSGFGGNFEVTLSGKVRPVLSPAGRVYDIAKDGRILMDFGDTKRQAAVIPAGSSRPRNLSVYETSAAVDISADGSEVLIHEGEAGSVFLRNISGSDPKKLGEGKALALSPDRRWALAVAREPSPHLVLLPTGAGTPRPLPAGSATLYYFASFFPDGQQIVFTASEGDHPRRSYLQGLAGGAPRPLGPEGMSATLVSPDGKWIAASTLEGGQVLMPALGGDPVPIRGIDPDDQLIQWSGDGGSLFVRGPEKEILTLFRVDLKTGKREPWREIAPPDPATFLEFESGPRGVRLTPDGKTVVYSFYTRSTTLGLVKGLR